MGDRFSHTFSLLVNSRVREGSWRPGLGPGVRGQYQPPASRGRPRHLCHSKVAQTLYKNRERQSSSRTLCLAAPSARHEGRAGPAPPNCRALQAWTEDRPRGHPELSFQLRLRLEHAPCPPSREVCREFTYGQLESVGPRAENGVTIPTGEAGPPKQNREPAGAPTPVS